MNFENEIKNLQTITSWNEKLKKIKIITKNIEKEEKKIEKLSNSINEEFNDEFNIKNNIKINIDDYLEKFYNENDLHNKIKIYKQICQYINYVEKEIFDE